MRQMSNCLWEAKFRRQKIKIIEKRNKFDELLTKEIQEITDNAVPVTTKRPHSSEWEYSTVRIVSSLKVFFFKSPVKSFKYEHWDFTPSWRLRNNNNFYLDVTEWLATAGGTKFLKPIEEMLKEELNVFLKRFVRLRERKIAPCQFTKVHQWNPSESRHWSFPSRSLHTFLYLSWPWFYWDK